MSLEMPFVYVFKFPFYTIVCMLTLSYKKVNLVNLSQEWVSNKKFGPGNKVYAVRLSNMGIMSMAVRLSI